MQKTVQIGQRCRMKDQSNQMLKGTLRIVGIQRVAYKGKNVDGVRVTSDWIGKNSRIGSQPVALEEIEIL